MALSRLTLWAPVILWAGLIFALSSIPDLGTDLGFWDLVLRKLAHVAEFAVLGALTYRALSVPGRKYGLGRPPKAEQAEDAGSVRIGLKYGRDRGRRHATACRRPGWAYLRPGALGREPAAIALASLYAVTDEVHQAFVAGRQGSALDWVLDSVGVVAGVVLLARMTASPPPAPDRGHHRR